MDVFLIAFLAWTLLALALGVGIGRAIHIADHTHQPEPANVTPRTDVHL